MGRSEVRDYEMPSAGPKAKLNSRNEIDVHGLTAQEAVSAVKQAVTGAGSAVYRIKVIHGFNRGTNIKDAIREEFSYGRNSKVKRVVGGDNLGVTELVLREY